MSAVGSVAAASSGFDVAADLAALDCLDVDGLRALWRKRLRGVPPGLPRPILMRLLAYRLQARVSGDLDAETAKLLDRIAREGARRRRAGEARPKAVPPVAPVPRPGGLKPGTVLMREHGGSVHHVMVVEGGFAWRGATYASLSEIARLITGTRWSGPRFFGLREGRDGSVPSHVDADPMLRSTGRAGDRHGPGAAPAEAPR